jgi:ankyrin repeat protein
LLLACGANVNAQESKFGQTPFRLAVTRGQEDVAELLSRHHEMLSRALRVENQEPIARRRPLRRSTNAEIARFDPKTVKLLSWVGVPILVAVLFALSWLILVHF